MVDVVWRWRKDGTQSWTIQYFYCEIENHSKSVAMILLFSLGIRNIGLNYDRSIVAKLERAYLENIESGLAVVQFETENQ